ncbi:hypothetical protein G6F35_016385 [Rhizopus arrhizus]|nr:hypothetical protein G6F35_016385 [Rhizopus arrhizus]
MVLGVTLGLISGYAGGRIDSFIMRIADVQLSFPAILVALLIDGVARGILPRDMHDQLALYVLIFAIGISGWVQITCKPRASSASAPSPSCAATSCPTSWARCWSSPPSTWRSPSSPRPRCRSWASACRSRRRRWAR